MSPPNDFKLWTHFLRMSVKLGRKGNTGTNFSNETALSGAPSSQLISGPQGWCNEFEEIVEVNVGESKKLYEFQNYLELRPGH